MVVGPGEEPDRVAVGIVDHEFAESLAVHLGRGDVASRIDQLSVDEIEIDDLEAEAPATARLSGRRPVEDRQPGVARVEQGIAVVHHPHENPQPKNRSIPLHELRPAGGAEFDAEQVRTAVLGHGEGGSEY